MKQMLKKMGVGFLVAIFLTVNMMPTLGVFAEAAETGSITIENPEPEKSYDIYQIFDLTYAGTTEKNVSYTLAPGWEDFFTTGDGKDYLVADTPENSKLNPIVVGNATKRINITKDNVDKFAAAAFAFAVKNKTPKTVTAGKNAAPVKESGLDLGYYLVYPRGATDVKEGQKSIVSLTSTTKDATVQIKATYPTITKKAKKTTADYGEGIPYTITGKVPDTNGYDTYIYTITDTLSEGLTLDANSVKVEIGGADKTADSNITCEKDVAAGTLKIDFKMLNLQDLKGKEIKVTYTAKLNDKAVIGQGGNAKGNTNKAQLTYSNNPKDSSQTTTPGETVSVYTGSITIDKHDGGDKNKKEKKKLSGAKFILQNAEKKYYKYDATTQKVSWVAKEEADTVETDKNGAAAFKGLKNGDYQLIETEAPKGYNKLTKGVAVTVKGESQVAADSLVADVENNTGSELPGTGGMGAKIFIIIGGGIGLLAAGMYRRNRKMNAGNR